jgi:hypothetical protein
LRRRQQQNGDNKGDNSHWLLLFRLYRGFSLFLIRDCSQIPRFMWI